MPRQVRLSAKDAIKLLEENSFIFSRQTGSHAQYYKDGLRVTIPIHGDKILHPKIVKQVLLAVSSKDD
jgi:predicted RNA binding protein YcfA (HicA-like mRNA interferase family)